MVTVFVQYLPDSVVHHMGRRGIQFRGKLSSESSLHATCVQIPILLKRPVWLGVVILIPFVTTLAVSMKARHLNYSTVVLISGNEKQERYSWYKM